MYQHERTNRIIGWSLGGFAFLTYLLTTAPVVAFWDNGEFIAVGYTLGVGHPPGSPVYTLITRLFGLLPFPNVARAINFESILTAALAIAVLYFIIAKMAKRWQGKITSFGDGLPTYVAGVTACLFTAFSFSFWENALEAEVYATNIFVMMLTLWLVLRWSELKEAPRDRRIIYLVIYVLALAVGVHMGCLLWAPAFLLFIIFFEKNYIGTVLLGLPFVLGFTLLSKGYIYGAFGLWILWLVITVFYAIPAFWPEAKAPRSRQERKRAIREGKPSKQHPAMLPPALLWGVGATQLILFFACVANYGSAGAGWFFGTVLVAGASIYGFVRLLQNGTIDRPEIPARIVLATVVLAVIALSVHAYLLIRARLKPAINESDPHTWKLVLDVMRRKQYEPMRFFPRRTPFSNQFSILWSYYRPQFAIRPLLAAGPLLLSVWGTIAHARRDKRTFAMMIVAAALSSIGLLFYMNISDHEVRTREYFWVPSYLGLAFWMGIGAGAIVEWAKGLGKSYRYVLAVALIIFSLVPLASNFHVMDRSDNYVAYYYGRNMIEFLDENAILITNGDNDTFPLWYLQQVEGVRPDVEIVNLSLIQINWYIKQLKERGLPTSLTFDQIEKMRPYWVRDPDTDELTLVTLRDIALHDIIRSNGWNRPVYFAVTVDDFMGYYDNLELEGMAFRLVQTTERHQVNEEKTYENIFENYRYDSLVDVDDGWRVMDEIYKPATTTRLVTNYAAGFSRLAFKAMQKVPPDVDEAVRLYEIGLKFAPDYAPALNGLVAIYAIRLHDPERALPIVTRLVASQPEPVESWIRYAGVNLMIAEKLERDQQSEEARPYYLDAMEAYEVALAKEPGRGEVYAPLGTIYQQLGEEQKLTNLLELWGRQAPEDFDAALQDAREFETRQRAEEEGAVERAPVKTRDGKEPGKR